MSSSTIAPPPRRPLRADARRNQARLLAAARETFAEDGAGACYDEIARRAGVGIGTLYRHFPTRWSLLVAIQGDDFQGLVAEADHLMATREPLDALAVWIRAVAAQAASYRGLAAEVILATGESGPATCPHGDELRAAARRLLGRAQAAGLVRVDIDETDLFTMVNGIVWADEQTAGQGGRVDRLLTLVIDGLRVRPAGSP